MGAIGDLLHAVADNVTQLEESNSSLSTQLSSVTAERDSLKAKLAELMVPNALRFDGAWQTRWGYAGGDLSRTRVVNDSIRGPVLEAWIPANQQMGFGFYGDLDVIGWGAADEFTFDYDIYFPSNYQWTNPSTGKGGGKMPGIAGAVKGKGTSVIGNGGDYSPYGWSMRPLWHIDRTIQPYLYVWNPRPTTGYGWAIPGRLQDASAVKLKIKDGWNTVRIRVKMNTPGISDGVLQMWLNGVLGLTHTGIGYRAPDRADLHVSHLYPGWFAGGGAADYPTVQNITRHDNYRKVA